MHIAHQGEESINEKIRQIVELISRLILLAFKQGSVRIQMFWSKTCYQASIVALLVSILALLSPIGDVTQNNAKVDPKTFVQHFAHRDRIHQKLTPRTRKHTGRRAGQAEEGTHGQRSKKEAGQGKRKPGRKPDKARAAQKRGKGAGRGGGAYTYLVRRGGPKQGRQQREPGHHSSDHSTAIRMR